MRRLLATALLLALAPAAAAQDAQIWPEHAAPDDEVAATARQAMPFTPEQIEMLGLLLQQVREATAEAAGPAADPQHRRLQIQPGHAGIPDVRLARGYTTAVSFTDSTGAPWPIEEVLVDQSFLPAQAGARPDGAQHLLYLAPLRANLSGNAVVKLAGRTDPVILHLGHSAASPDVRIDIRLAEAGPAADLEALIRLPPFQAGDAAPLHLPPGGAPPAGLPPAGATRLVVSGGQASDRAWATGDDVLLVTAASILTPGPWAAERAADGRWAYRLPATPFALVSASGVDYRIDFRAAAAATLDGILP